jgi:RNA-binding protein YhbY
MARKNFQMNIGKNGLTEGFLNQLKNAFENENLVKVVILPSATRDRETAKKMTLEITNFLGEKFTARLIGFTITVQKWRRMKSEK